MRNTDNGASRPITRPILDSQSPQPTAVSGKAAKASERVPRNGVSVPGLRRYGGPVVQPPVPARAPFRRKEVSTAPLHPALQRKLLVPQDEDAVDAPHALPPSRSPLSPQSHPAEEADPVDAPAPARTNTAGATDFMRLRDAFVLRPSTPASGLDDAMIAPPSTSFLPDLAVLPALSASNMGEANAEVPTTALMSVAATPLLSTETPVLVPVIPSPQDFPERSAQHRQTAWIITRPDWQAGIVGLFSLLIGIAAVIISAGQNLILQYPDARSHLEIARRVFDNRTPGLVQLGTVWLPVPHLLLLPFVNIDVLWATGLAGSIVGVICFVITTVTLFLAVFQLTGRTLPAWIAAVVMLTNPSFLYIQTTALTEPVLLATMTSATYFLLRWMRDRQAKWLLAAGVLSALAVGSRYDGWFFAVVSTLAIALTVLAGQRRWAAIQGIALTYAIVPLYTVAMWLLYNWIYFGDALEFQRGAFSAQQQQKIFETLGQLGTKHHLLLAGRTYLWAIDNNAGIVIVSLAVIGLIVYLVTTRLRADSYLPYVFLAPIPFNILALWLGQTTIRVPQVSPDEYFNIRYGLLILPGLALFIAYLYHRLTIKGGNRIALPLFAALLVCQGALWWTPDFPRQVPVVAEGVNAGEADTYVVDAAHYLHASYQGGAILFDDSTTHITTLARIPIHEYVSNFSGALWQAALTDPTPVAEWIVVSEDTQDGGGDTLLNAARENPSYFAAYDTVFTNQGITIYKRHGTAT